MNKFSFSLALLVTVFAYTASHAEGDEHKDATPEHEVGVAQNESAKAAEHQVEGKQDEPAKAAEHHPAASENQAGVAETPEHEQPVVAQKPAHVATMAEMRSALKSGKPALEKLIQEGADINAKDPRTGLTLLHEAASEGNVARVQTLKEVGADMNVQNNQGGTALHMASRIGHIKVAQKLAELGVKTDVKNAQGLTAHAVAKANGNKPIADALENHPK